MKTYVYPAVLVLEKDGTHYMSIPDLNLHTKGSSEEEAFLEAKEAIKSYFDLAERFDTIIPTPTSFNEASKTYKKHKIVMIDIAVKVNNPELTQEEEDYKNFMKMFFDEA